MRIHLGHHFYGAGNVGDDFMLAGFLHAIRTLAPDTSFTSASPFALDPLRQRFPEVAWHGIDLRDREASIASCEAWLGLGGSPFQSAQSRWFLDHLVSEAELCRRHGKPMFYLGVGVQEAAELRVDDVREVCAQAAGIWARDAASAERLAGARSNAVRLGADLAHVFFSANRPPPAVAGRITACVNFNYGAWPGCAAFLAAAEKLQPAERIWLAQEARELPGAEKAIHGQLPPHARSRWCLVTPDSMPGAPLSGVLQRWPAGAWTVTARHHAAIAAAWSGAATVVIGTNAKLHAIASDLGVPLIAPDADEQALLRAIDAATPAVPPLSAAALAFDACREFCRAAGLPEQRPDTAGQPA